MKTAAKDFKMTELGPIPKDWEVKRLGDLSSVITKGTTPTSIGCDYVNSGINFIKAESITDEGLFLPEMFAHIDDETNHLLGRSQLVRGDYLFSIAGVLGRVACVPDDVLPANTNQALAIIRLSSDNDLDRRFIFYSLKAKPVEDYISNVNVAAAQANLSLENVADLPMVLPPLPEQRKIAAVLSDVDEMITALEKLIGKKRKIKTGAMQRLLTGKTRLPGFKGAWVEKRLGELGETYNGIGGKTKDDFGKGPARYITFLNVLTNPVLDETLFEPVNVLPADGQNRAKKGDLFFNTSSETPEEVGICSMLATDQVELYLNSFCFGFRLFDDNISPLFLSYYFRSADGRLLMTTLAQGSTRYNLSKESFKDACIAIPPTLAEQKAIAKVLGDIDEEIAAIEAELAKARQLKQGMMQELLTGKVRLM